MRLGAMSKRGEALAIRRAGRPDQDGIEKLLRRASEGRLNELERFVSLLPERLGKGEILVAARDGEILGTAAIVQGALEGVFVEPAWRGCGIGRALIGEATHEARRSGLALVVLCDLESSGFYRRCGFVLEVETKTQLGAALVMSR